MALREKHEGEHEPSVQLSIRIPTEAYRKLEQNFAENPPTLDQSLSNLVLQALAELAERLPNDEQERTEVRQLLSTAQVRIYLDKNLWKEPESDGSEKWFAIDPQTGETVEIDPDQAYFWTEEWQKGEREADEDIAAGRYADFDDVDDFFDTRIP